jgi:glutamate synthase domain-containing protein 2
MKVRSTFLILSIVIPLATLILVVFWPNAWWLFIVILPVIALGFYDMVQRKHTILRIYPVVGHLRYVFESIRPEIQQYFVESNTNGQPVSREFRSLVYQRAKGERDTLPFGTQFEVYRDGYEWFNHSLAPKPVQESNPRIHFGGQECIKPYDASPLNISAMSFGALSQNAILA